MSKIWRRLYSLSRRAWSARLSSSISRVAPIHSSKVPSACPEGLGASEEPAVVSLSVTDSVIVLTALARAQTI